MKHTIYDQYLAPWNKKACQDMATNVYYNYDYSFEAINVFKSLEQEFDKEASAMMLLHTAHEWIFKLSQFSVYILHPYILRTITLYQSFRKFFCASVYIAHPNFAERNKLV